MERRNALKLMIASMTAPAYIANGLMRVKPVIVPETVDIWKIWDLDTGMRTEYIQRNEYHQLILNNIQMAVNGFGFREEDTLYMGRGIMELMDIRGIEPFLIKAYHG